MNVEELQALEKDAQVLRAAVDGAQLEEAKPLLARLKVRISPLIFSQQHPLPSHSLFALISIAQLALTTLPSLPPSTVEASATASQERSIARTFDGILCMRME